MTPSASSQPTRRAGSGRTKHERGLFDGRTRFNWGYHDGAQDVLNPAFMVRELVNDFDGAKPRTAQVSRNYQPAYFYGYREGVEDARAGLYKRDSQQAWDRTSTHPKVLVLRPTANR